MKFWLPVSLASLLMLPAASFPFQAHPQFTGTWRLDPERSESAAEDPTPGPVTVDITQTEKEFTIVTNKGGQQYKAAYGFVATPATPFAVETGTRAYWNGAALVTEGTRLVQGQTVAARETRTLSSDGKEMVVEVVVIVQHGYQTRGGRNYGMGRDVYTRVSQ